VIFSIIILITPYIPTTLLLFLDNIIIRTILIISLLYLIRCGPLTTIFGFMTIAILYLERNRRKGIIATDKLNNMEIPKYALYNEALQPQTNVSVPFIQDPNIDVSDFIAHNDMTTDTFEPVDVTINQKKVLASIYPLQKDAGSSHADTLFERLGLGHLSNIETME